MLSGSTRHPRERLGMAGSSLRQAHVDETRRAVLASARRHFGRRGFHATSLDDVAAGAGVTKGALYYHFRSKEDLFVAVYDQIEAELSEFAAEAGRGAGDPVEALRRGFAAFLDRATDSEVRRIGLLDASSVLGAATKLEIDARHSIAGVRRAIELGIASGALEPLDPETVARLLIAACGEAALMIATADDPDAARPRAGAALDRLLVGLAPRRPVPRGATKRTRRSSA